MRKVLAVFIVLVVAALGFWWTHHLARIPDVTDEPHVTAPDAGPGDAGARSPSQELVQPGEIATGTSRKDAAQEVPSTQQEPELVVGGRVLMVPENGSAADAQPLEGATVEVGVSDPKLTATTGPDGRFRLTMFDRGDRPMSTLLAVAGGAELMSWSRRVDFTEGMSGPEDLVIYLVHAPVATGRVLTPDGLPVAGATIRHKKSDHGTTSDEEGLFALPGLPHSDLSSPLQLEDRLLATKPGSSLVSIDAPGLDANMVWQPIQIVMAPSGTLTVEAKAADGTPLPKLQLNLDLSPDGPFSRSDRAVFGYSFDALYGSTDEAGMCRFEGVPANVNMRLTLGGTLEFEAVDPRATLVLNGRSQTQGLRPLNVPPGGETKVRYRPDAYVTLKGVVLEADGSPSANARLRFDAARAESTATALNPRRARTNEDGTFEVPVAITGPMASATDQVVIRAQSTDGERGSYSPFGGAVFPDPLCFAQGTVAVAAPRPVTLRLSPQSRLSGRIMGPDGPFEGYVTVRLTPESEAAPLDFIVGAYTASSITVSSGTFEFRSVPPGTYRLEARSSEHGVTTVSGVPHGASDVVLRFGEPAVAQVVLNVSSAAGVSGITVDHADIQVSRHVPAPSTLPARSTFVDPIGYDGGGLSMSSGSAGMHTKGIRGSASVTHFPGNEHTLTLAPGQHWIGLRGTDSEGHPLFPVGTGPLEISEGTHEIRFELHGTASLTGHMQSGDIGGSERMAELHLPDGTLVPCIGTRAGMQSSFRVASNGQFRIARLPACPLELWIGTRAELEARRAPYIRKIDPKAQENLDLKIGG